MRKKGARDACALRGGEREEKKKRRGRTDGTIYRLTSVPIRIGKRGEDDMRRFLLLFSS